MEERLQLPHPTLILLMGVAGSGKTTLAGKLLRRLNAVYLDNNFIADPFFPHTRSDAAYRKIRPQLYDVLYRITAENLKIGNSVLLDVPHVTHMKDENWHLFLQNLVADSQCALAIVRCFCSPETLRRRLMERGEKRDRQKLDNWDVHLQQQPIRMPIPFDHLDIDTEADLARNVRRVMAYIVARPIGT